MATSFAKTSFGTTPDDKAVVVDVYKEPPLTPVNTQVKSMLGSVDGFLGSISNITGKYSGIANKYLGAANKFVGKGSLGGGLVKELTTNYLQTGKLITLSKDGAIKGAAAALGIPNGDIYDVGTRTLNGVLKGTGFYASGIGELVNGISTSITGNSLDKNLMGGYKDVVKTVNNVHEFIEKVQDIDSFKDMATLLGTITGDEDYLKVFNLTEAAGVFKGLSDMATSLGITDSLDKLFNTVDNEVSRYHLSSLIASGTTNWDNLYTVDTLLDNLTGAELLNANPEVVLGILRGFDRTSEYPTASKEAADAVMERLVKIDPRWNEIMVSDGTYKPDLDVFLACGDFMRECFIAGGYYLTELAIVPEIKQRTFTELANRDFEYIAI